MPPASWLWPHWLERQVDPRAAEFVPDDDRWPTPTRHLPAQLAHEPRNTTGRNWTLIGNLSSWRRAAVDARGLVTPREGGFSLDWWVGAEDRWHLPSREAAVRQTLHEGVPVVETAMRVPGGDVVHRAFAVRSGRDDIAVVEIENRTSVPVALALAVRPYHLTGLASIHEIRLEATRVYVDGVLGVSFARPPARLATSTAAHPDAVEVVVDGAAEATTMDVPVHDPDGLANAAFIFPLAHTAVLRCALPIDGRALPPQPGRGRRRPPVEAVTEPDPAALPGVARVVSGWQAQGGRGLRLELPDARLTEAVASARRHLLLVAGGEDVVTYPTAAFDYPDAVDVLGALDVMGWRDEVEHVLASWPERVRSDGWFAGDDSRPDRNGAALVAVAAHARLAPDALLTDDALLALVGAAQAVGRRRQRVPLAAADLLWALHGLAGLAVVLELAGQADASAAAEAASRDVAERVVELVTSATDDPDPTALLPLIDLDHAAVPEPVGAMLGRALAAVQDSCVDAAVFLSAGPQGLSPRHTGRLARLEVHRGDRRALDRLAWLVGVASPTWGWPEVADVRGRGVRGAGHDGVATAAFLRLVRDMVVHEMPGRPGALAVCGVWPDEWLGQGLEVHGAPTAAGTVSFAVRWHGERPALLWEVTPDEAADPVPLSLRAPGLDPAWSTTEPRGEALLGVIPATPPSETSSSEHRPERPTIDPGASFA